MNVDAVLDEGVRLLTQRRRSPSGAQPAMAAWFYAHAEELIRVAEAAQECLIAYGDPDHKNEARAMGRLSLALDALGETR